MFTRIGLVSLGAVLAVLAGSVRDVPRAVAQDGKLKFEMYQDNAKEFRWRLKAANGAVLATGGQGYKAKADCQKGVERIKADVAGDKLKFEVYEDNAKQFRWRLKAANGQVIATASEGYKAKADCEKAIDLIKKNAGNAEVADMT
jgi:uncharacterized protein